MGTCSGSYAEVTCAGSVLVLCHKAMQGTATASYTGTVNAPAPLWVLLKLHLHLCLQPQQTGVQLAGLLCIVCALSPTPLSKSRLHVAKWHKAAGKLCMLLYMLHMPRTCSIFPDRIRRCTCSTPCRIHWTLPISCASSTACLTGPLG